MKFVETPDVHIWFVSIGQWQFGICEDEPLLGAIPTTIFLGPLSFDTNLSAHILLAIAGAGLMVAITVLAFAALRFIPKRA